MVISTISKMGQRVFVTLMSISLLLTICAFLTPGWSSFSVKKGHESEAEKFAMPESVGLFQCISSKSKGSLKIDYCQLWDTNRTKCEKIVAKVMIVAIILQIVLLIWIAVTFFRCRYSELLVILLPIITFVAATVLGIAVLMYTRNTKNKLAFKTLKANRKAASEAYTIDFFYSYHAACFALLFTIANIFVGAYTAKPFQISCI